MGALDKIAAQVEGCSPAPWQHEAWGGQNQNGDYAGGDVFDANGERVVSEVMDADGALIEAAPKLLAALQAVEALAEQWRYKGEFGGGAWQEGEGPDQEGCVLDDVAAAIKAAVAEALQ